MKDAGRLFGFALDTSDDPFSLQLKHGAMSAKARGMEGLCADPYEVILERLQRRSGLEPAGSFPIPSWLTAMPDPGDNDLVNVARLGRFVGEEGVLQLVTALRQFVAGRIMPAMPVMVGVDHAGTGAVVAAIAECIGPENLTVVTLDRHFDAIPPSVRVAALENDWGSGMQLFSDGGDSDAYCCGNFWAHLIERRLVDPKHMLFVGVADYPPEVVPAEWGPFREAYLSYERLGCRFFPLSACDQADRSRRLNSFLADGVNTPYVYVSLDLDVGSYRAVHAARYMDGPGIEGEAITEVARTIAAGCRSGRFSLAGLDVMEFNMHLLGLQRETGERDRTVEIAAEFIETLIGGAAD